ncbi:defense protein l(2)34Fc [Hyalella azteca]|uniref:Defense protein l(2)34Fc n=1 Tax=Hyalella azteca TaxID=294128 RepID=A0A8B7N205_HYAAZ|nr:defense protein l(2)34Fc [Hyalella azteca]
MMKCLLVMALFGALALTCSAYSRGAPQGACDTMEPLGHSGARRNPAPNPYSLSAPSKANPSDTITVELSGADFKGYMIQAVTPKGQVVGTFTTSGLSCNPQTQARDTATHSSSNVVRNITVQWVAPPDAAGIVYFRGTVVQDYSNYYTNIYSNPVSFGPAE